jgi:hypothetical protein
MSKNKSTDARSLQWFEKKGGDRSLGGRLAYAPTSLTGPCRHGYGAAIALHLAADGALGCTRGRNRDGEAGESELPEGNGMGHDDQRPRWRAVDEIRAKTTAFDKAGEGAKDPLFGRGRYAA